MRIHISNPSHCSKRITKCLSGVFHKRKNASEQRKWVLARKRMEPRISLLTWRRILFCCNGVHWKVVSLSHLIRLRFLIAIISLLNDESLKTTPAFTQIQSSVQGIAVRCCHVLLSGRTSFLNFKSNWIRSLNAFVMSLHCFIMVTNAARNSECSDEGRCGCRLW